MTRVVELASSDWLSGLFVYRRNCRRNYYRIKRRLSAVQTVFHIAYMDRIDTSNFANSCNVASTSQRMSNYIVPKKAGSGLWSFKNCCVWICTKQKGDHQVGNLHVNCQHLVFIFSRHTFLDVGKPTCPKLSHMTWLSIQQNLCYSDFFKVPHKTNGGRKTQNLFHFSCQVADI